MRGIEHMRRDVDSGKLEATEEVLTKLTRAERALTKRAAITNEHGYRDAEATADFTEEDVAALRPFYVARNRWHMAYMLIKNPSLRRYRRLQLRAKADFMESIEQSLQGLARTASFAITSAVPIMGSGTAVELEVIDSDEVADEVSNEESVEEMAEDGRPPSPPAVLGPF